MGAIECDNKGPDVPAGGEKSSEDPFLNHFTFLFEAPQLA